MLILLIKSFHFMMLSSVNDLSGYYWFKWVEFILELLNVLENNN
jgi:hypothetical protein